MNNSTGPGEASNPADASSAAESGEASRSEEPISAAPPRAPADEAESPGEEPASMSLPHVHAPHGGIHGWRDLLVHISVITIGLLLALGLEQTVESIHHARQRAELEEQMRETLEANSRVIADDLNILANYRAYLVDLQRAVAARRQGLAKPDAPLASDPRTYTYAPPPMLGAYQASKANGTVALLSLDRIRIYDRLAFQYEFGLDDLRRYIGTLVALRAFRQRFEPAEATSGVTLPVLPVDIASLSSGELVEYQALIGDGLEASTQFSQRLKRIDIMGRAVLDGARHEEDLLKAITDAQGDRIN